LYLEDQHLPDLLVACGANLPHASLLRDAQGRRVPRRIVACTATTPTWSSDQVISAPVASVA
jgi:hypothetical protein